MCSQSPPPPHTSEPSSQFKTTKAQWDIVHQYLKTIYLPKYQTLNTLLPSSPDIDRKVLAIALIKKSAEHSILTSEAKHAELAAKQQISIHFPNYDVGFPQTHSQSSTPKPSSSSTPAAYTTGHKLFISTSSNNSTEHKIGVAEQGADQISPLSPTFGPRRNHRFSGTVSRRRSGQYGAPLPRNETSTSAQDDSGCTEKVLSDWERRIIWEAAWIEIERNLDFYVERFGLSDQNRGSKESIWEELVRLKTSCGGLEEKIRGLREDLRG